MRKFQAIYRVTVYTQDETILVGAHIETDKDGKKQIVQDEAKLTCEFSVNRGILSDSSNCDIKLYNLAPSTREKINTDAFTFDTSKWKFVRLEAGYTGNLCRIFEGRILQAFSAHSGGSPDIVTNIQAQALDILDCQTSHTFEAGTTYKQAVQTIVTTDMPNTTIGNVGELNGEFKTPTAVDGNVGDALSSITGGQAFVDNGMLNVIMSNEVIDVPVPVITDDNGLLETPIRRDANMEVKILFQPDLIVGQLLEIKSAVAPKFNGQFKVVGFTHNCTISGAQAGTRITTVNLYLGPYLPGAQEIIAGQTQNNFNKVRGYEVEPVTLNEPSQVREVHKYIQENNGKIPNTKITANITWRDMLGHSNTDSDRKKEVTIKILSNCVAVATQLQGIYNKFWRGRKLAISSGWRSKQNNKRCGGAVKSRHLVGAAIDFNLGQNKLKSDFNIIKNTWNGFKLYEGTWIHVDLQGSRRGYANDK